MFVKRFYMHSKTFITVLKQRQWKKLTINHMRTLWYVCFITGTEHKALPSSLMITLNTQHEWHMSAFLLLFQAHLCSGSQIQRKEPHRGGFWTRDIMCFLSISSSLCLLAPIIFYLISVYKIPAHNKLKWIYWNPLHIAIFEITDKKHQISIIYSVYLPFGKCIMCIASFVDFIAVRIEYLQSISLLHHIMKYSVNGSYSLYAGGLYG